MLIPTNTGRLSSRRLLWTWITAKSSSKILARANAGLAMRRLSLSSSFERTSFTSTRIRRFSMVFPKTELFINVEVLLEDAGGLLPELSIHPDVWLHPRSLVESKGAVDRSQTQAQRQIQLQIPIMKYIAALVVEVWDQLLNLCWRHSNAEEVVLILRHPLLLNNHALRCQRI